MRAHRPSCSSKRRERCVSAISRPSSGGAAGSPRSPAPAPAHVGHGRTAHEASARPAGPAPLMRTWGWAEGVGGHGDGAKSPGIKPSQPGRRNRLDADLGVCAAEIQARVGSGRGGARRDAVRGRPRTSGATPDRPFRVQTPSGQGDLQGHSSLPARCWCPSTPRRRLDWPRNSPGAGLDFCRTDSEPAASSAARSASPTRAGGLFRAPGRAPAPRPHARPRH